MLMVPKLVVLNLTTDCNMRCKYCYASAGDFKKYMRVDTAIKVVDELKLVNGEGIIKVLFHGGEPLLCFDVIQAVVFHCEEKYPGRVEFYIQTNCVLLDEEKVKYFKEHEVRISISIDGCDEITNDCRVLVNGQNGINHIKTSINLLKKYNIQINALAVLNKKNYADVKRIIDYFVMENIYAFSFNYFIKGGRGNDNSDLAIDNDELFETTINILQAVEKYYRQGICLNEKNTYYLVNSVLTNTKKYMCANSPCGAGLNIFGITPDGEIYPCDDLSSQKQFCLGNINDASLEEILNSKIIEYFAYCNYKKIEECKNCNIKSFCGAGCCSRKYYENDTIYSKDPICSFYKRIIPCLQDMIEKNEITRDIYDG